MSPWKLTPRAPDDNMVEAGILEVDACNEDNAAACTAEHCWPGMWDAAPAVPDEVVERAAKVMLIAVDREARDYEAAGRPDADQVCDFSNLDELPPAIRDGWLRVVRAALAAVGAE